MQSTQVPKEIALAQAYSPDLLLRAQPYSWSFVPSAPLIRFHAILAFPSTERTPQEAYLDILRRALFVRDRPVVVVVALPGREATQLRNALQSAAPTSARILSASTLEEAAIILRRLFAVQPMFDALQTIQSAVLLSTSQPGGLALHKNKLFELASLDLNTRQKQVDAFLELAGSWSKPDVQTALRVYVSHSLSATVQFIQKIASKLLGGEFVQPKDSPPSKVAERLASALKLELDGLAEEELTSANESMWALARTRLCEYLEKEVCRSAGPQFGPQTRTFCLPELHETLVELEDSVVPPPLPLPTQIRVPSGESPDLNELRPPIINLLWQSTTQSRTDIFVSASDTGYILRVPDGLAELLAERLGGRLSPIFQLSTYETGPAEIGRLRCCRLTFEEKYLHICGVLQSQYHDYKSALHPDTVFVIFPDKTDLLVQLEIALCALSQRFGFPVVTLLPDTLGSLYQAHPEIGLQSVDLVEGLRSLQAIVGGWSEAGPLHQCRFLTISSLPGLGCPETWLGSLPESISPSIFRTDRLKSGELIGQQAVGLLTGHLAWFPKTDVSEVPPIRTDFIRLEQIDDASVKAVVHNLIGAKTLLSFVGPKGGAKALVLNKLVKRLAFPEQVQSRADISELPCLLRVYGTALSLRDLNSTAGS